MAIFKLVCAIKKCRRQFVSRIDSPYCYRCRRNIFGWAKRPVKDIMDRADDLARWSERNSIVAQQATAKGNGNVVSFRRRRNG